MFTIISGDVPKRFKKGKKIGKIKGPLNLKRNGKGPKKLVMHEPGLDSGYIYVGFYTLDIEKDVRGTIMLELLLKYLCRSFNSVLHRILRIKMGLSYSVRCLGSNSFFSHIAGGYGYKGFVASMNKSNIPLGSKKVAQIIEYVRKNGVEHEERLETIKKMFLTSFRKLLQSTLNRVFYFGTSISKYGKVIPPETIIRITKNIKRGELNTFIKKVLAPSRTYTILIKN